MLRNCSEIHPRELSRRTHAYWSYCRVHQGDVTYIVMATDCWWRHVTLRPLAGYLMYSEYQRQCRHWYDARSVILTKCPVKSSILRPWWKVVRAWAQQATAGAITDRYGAVVSRERCRRRLHRSVLGERALTYSKPCMPVADRDNSVRPVRNPTDLDTRVQVDAFIYLFIKQLYININIHY